jgi:hypothetical protein
MPSLEDAEARLWRVQEDIARASDEDSFNDAVSAHSEAWPEWAQAYRLRHGEISDEDLTRLEERSMQERGIHSAFGANFERFELQGPPPTSPRREAISARVRREVWNRDGGRCVDCGSREHLEYDHIIPVSRGGANTARNIELRCEPCNRKKGAQI